MTHQLNIFLLLFGALQGLLLSLWFLKNSKDKVANVYFAALLTVAGLQLTFKVISKSWMMSNMNFPYQLSYLFPYLVGPLLFLYLKARKDNRFGWRHMLHFLPFIVVAFAGEFMPRWLTPWIYGPYRQAILQSVSLLIYCFLSFRLDMPQLRNFVLSVMVVEELVILALAFMYVFYRQIPDMRLLFVGLTLLIYWISYKAVSQPDLFAGEREVTMVPISAPAQKYAHSSLKPEDALRIERELSQKVQRDKIFLDPSLTIDALASQLGASRHHVSQVLNERMGKTFGDFITDLRLEEAQRRLGDPHHYRFTIAAIALDSGFNSVSSFNDVFKKHFGLTPSRFREQQLKRRSA